MEQVKHWTLVRKPDKIRGYSSLACASPEKLSLDVDRERGYPDSPTFSNDSYYDGSEYSGSSRASSQSYKLVPAPPAVRSNRFSNICFYILPSRTTRYLCLLLGSTIIILILSLFRMSVVSSRRVEVEALHTKEPPVTWDQFPFLTRYYGGIRTLVPASDNQPEYPAFAGDNVSSNATASEGPDANDGSEQTDHITDGKRQSRTLPSSHAFNPYPAYTSREYLAQHAPVTDCLKSSMLNHPIPHLQVYEGIPKGFPDPIIGSYEVLGLDRNVCFDRYGKLGPYGYGYSLRAGGTGAGMYGDREGVEDVWQRRGEVDFRKVNWAKLQQDCLDSNRHRFVKISAREATNRFEMLHKSTSKIARRDASSSGSPATPGTPQPNSQSAARTTPSKAPLTTGKDGPAETGPDSTVDAQTPRKAKGDKKLLPRTAVIIRTWSSYQYSEEDIMLLRSLISELSIRSGGEYTVHILVQVRDDNLQIWADEDLYQDVLQHSLPEEFWGLATLWTERQMGLIYGGIQETFYENLPVHGVYRSSFMPIQWFAHHHPEFDYFWQWEMDARYTGHFYHLFDRLGKWSREQPRKGLWERNGRFYVPSVHDSWEDFKSMVRWQTEMGTDDANNIWSGLQAASGRTSSNHGKGDKSVWGPERPLDDELNTENDVIPPHSYEQDKYEWGVGEEADLITLDPLFDPEGTAWLLAGDVTGYNKSRGLPPRRAAIVTASRLSKRLLQTMHHETAKMRHHMFSEMWPASCALHHGFKAVYAPHPVYVDRKWPTSYLATVFNGGRNGATGGARTSVFGQSREHNFRGMTWYFNAGFAPNLWKRWLGLRIDGGGGEEAEVAGEGRMCLPAVLLHPVKDVHLIVESEVGNKGE
ncbi:MAG: hypothetical protein M1825_003766 [Sarcosagium campestre]|nr:MAG: hypothetical protein M1825_003766 [Sarcosagium campestre]